MDASSSDWNRVLAAFQKIWGYDNFRPPQGEVVRALLEGKDATVILPTGSGKSVCFQLPALLQTGLTLVVSPLVALMENQVRQLQQRHLPAALLHGELPAWQRKETLHAIEKQKLRLLYLSPETLLTPPVWQRLSRSPIKINGLIIDEAHCLVEWGETFRPAYRRLGAIRPALLKNQPLDTKIAIAAFSATAAPNTRQVLRDVLQLRQPESFLVSPYRSNLHLQVRVVWTPRGRRQQMLDFIKVRGDFSGLVYVRSRQDSEELARWFISLNYRAAAYHAGLHPQQRRQVETDWLSGKIQFAVSTSAFGMGIDKPDVRWIVHFHPPQLLSEYIQEVGRAGRDAKVADALTLISEPSGWFDPEDKQRRQFFALQLQKQHRQACKIAKQIPLQGDADTVAKQFPDGEIALALLHSIGHLHWQNPFQYRLKGDDLTDSFTRLARAHRQAELQTIAYLRTPQCRWQFLLAAFGFSREATGFKCNCCDNCKRSIE